jgi:hypothetical protein
LIVVPQYEGYGFGIETVLFQKDPRGKRVFSVVIYYRHDLLRNDGAAVESLVNKMDRTSAPLNSMGDGLPLSVKTAETWEQAGMNIQDAVWKCV